MVFRNFYPGPAIHPLQKPGLQSAGGQSASARFSPCPVAPCIREASPEKVYVKGQNGLQTHPHPGWPHVQDMLQCLGNMTTNVTPELDPSLQCGLNRTEATGRIPLLS